MLTKKQLITFAKTPVFIVLIISLIIMAVNIIVIGRLRPFNSDDLYWQLAVRTWIPFSGETLYLATRDTFVEIVPLFIILEHLFEPSRKLLLAEVGILTLSTLVMCYVASIYFFKKLRIKLTYLTLLPFIWIASFGYPLVQNYLNADWRTFEVGISFLTFMLVGAICFGDFKPLSSLRSKLLSLLATAYIGIVIFSDPYYVYFTIGPILLFSALLFWLKKIKRRELFIIYGGAIISFVFSAITELLLYAAGIVIVTDHPAAFVHFDNILTNIIAALHGLLIIFGANFFGNPIASIYTIGSAVNALILGIVIYSVYRMRELFTPSAIKKLSLQQLWIFFFGLMLPFIFTVYTLSSLAMVSNYRFYIIFVFCTATFLVFILASWKNVRARYAASVLLVGATVFNLAHTAFSDTVLLQPDVTGNVGNSANLDIVHAVEKEGLTKGYTSYWHGNVNTYFAKGNTVFLPAICDAGQTKPFQWLIEGSLYKRPAAKSFYLIDPEKTAPPTCDPDKMKAQFGEPEKTLAVGNKTIVIYNYDITSKMGKPWQPGE